MREKKRYKKLVKRLFEGLKLNLKKLREHSRGCNKVGGKKRLHCYDFEAVKKKCSLSVLLTGITIGIGFREKKAIQKLKLSEW